jgi:hypothetical protein
MSKLKFILLLNFAFSIITSCDKPNNVDLYSSKLDSLKISLSQDSIFQKSPLKELVMQTDITFGHYINIVDTLKDLKNSLYINSFIFKFIDIDSIINPAVDEITLIDSSDTREIVKLKLITDEIILLNRIYYYFNNQDQISRIKIIRVSPSLQIGQYKRIIVFVPKSYQVISSDSGYFNGYGKFLQFISKVTDNKNDSISFRAFNKFSNKEYISYFEIFY